MIHPALSLLLLSRLASADLEIRWRDAPGCISVEPLPSRVAALMNHRASPPATLELAAAEDEQGWQISMAVHSTTRSFDRTLHGRDCTTLTEAVALIVAVQLDPVAVASALETTEP
ncbi:MAG: hypothetical protein KDK70_36500, partial [Myxococcales bacterium]|nr:hypothetical protein [Myxococcales bacterium]